MNQFDYYLKIENPLGLPVDVTKITTHTLTSNKKITFPAWLMGGGQDQKYYFLEVLGNKKYTNGFEWCAGHGEIGFEIVTNGIADTMTFSDLHPGSAEWCIKNSIDLEISDKVQAFTSSTISNLPNNVKWDLVVSNPPNAVNADLNELQRMREEGQTDDHILLFARTTWDYKFQTHKEFFENIGNYTTDNVDMYITIQDSTIDLANNLAKKNNLRIENIYDMIASLKIVHFVKC